MESSQISFNAAFIQNLLLKLKIGNRRSIHLNALPGRLRARLDLADLEVLAPGKAELFLKHLLTEKAFSFDISFQDLHMEELEEEQKEQLFLLGKRLDNMTYDAEDQFLEFGIKNFGLGYPLLIRQDTVDPTKIVKAPLFIWRLDIQKSTRKSNAWTIKRQEDAPILLNEVLRNHVLHDARIEISPSLEEAFADGLVTEEELVKLCESILQQLHPSEVSPEKALKRTLEKSPPKEKLETLATAAPWIQWSGIFGLYQTRKESIIKTNEALLTNLTLLQNEPLLLEDFQTSTISAVPTDPSKEELIKSLTKSEIKLIQGPPGTGKSQALTAIITNVLENGGRCLVVCEKKTALDVIYKNLEKIGLDAYTALIDDVNGDRALTVRKARERKDQRSQPDMGRATADFASLYTQFVVLRDLFNEKHRAVFTQVLAGMSWKEAIGLFLKYEKSSFFEQVKRSLSQDGFLFTQEEFTTLQSLVERAAYLYKNISFERTKWLFTLPAPSFAQPYTRAQHDRLRVDADQRVEIVKTIRRLVQEASAVQVQGYTILSRQALESGRDQLMQQISSLTRGIQLIQELCSSPRMADPTRGITISFGERVKGLFQSAVKMTNEKKREVTNIRALYYAFAQGFPDGRYPVVSWEQHPSLSRLQGDLVRAKELLGHELAGLEILISRYHSILAQEDQWHGLDNHFPSCELPLLAIQTDLFGYEQKLEQLSREVTSLPEELNEYEQVHHWRHFFGTLDAKTQRVTQALFSVPSTEWLDVFRAWYLYKTLNQREADIGPFHTSNEELAALAKMSQDLKKKQLKKIEALWNGRLATAIERFEQTEKGNMNLLYNLAGNSKYRGTNSLRRIVQTDVELFTTIFPAILTNPMTVDAILPMKVGSFEVVIFDEASQLRIEDTFTSLIRGKYKIIAGDKHQMPPADDFQSSVSLVTGEEEMADDEELFEQTQTQIDQGLAQAESLLDYANNLPRKSQSYLDYHYRSKHPALIEFSNAAFYGGNLVAFPEGTAYTAIALRQIDGVYQDNLNPEEAQDVLRIIEENIHPTEAGVWPSLGIATFNIKQRDLIRSLLDERCVVDEAFAKKMDGIRAAGLFIKNLENIQGDEMDVMIISTTYGKNSDGRFLARFGPINQAKGYRLLNVLITRAKERVFICTSIPREIYEGYTASLTQTGNTRIGILYAYLAYAQALSQGEGDRVEAILRTLRASTLEQERLGARAPLGLTESPFEQEVYECLLEYFSRNQILPQYKVGGFRIDFVILYEGEKVAVECDGKAYHSSDTAHAYDIFRQQELEKMGFRVYHLWSTRWWHDHQKEIRALVSFVRNESQDVATNEPT